MIVPATTVSPLSMTGVIQSLSPVHAPDTTVGAWPKASLKSATIAARCVVAANVDKPSIPACSAKECPLASQRASCSFNAAGAVAR